MQGTTGEQPNKEPKKLISYSVTITRYDTAVSGVGGVSKRKMIVKELCMITQIQHHPGKDQPTRAPVR